MRNALLLGFFPLLACARPQVEADTCAGVSGAFLEWTTTALSDTTGIFARDYPRPTPLTCEALEGLERATEDDSVQYLLERLHQRYRDPRASAAFAYIGRHNDFYLPMALATHWNPDTRIEAVRAVRNYRRIRPMVCATKERYAQLEKQDRQAVRYFIRVLETTPLSISGSENSTIHSIYMREVMLTLDLFTGQKHLGTGDGQIYLEMSEKELQQALTDWRNWLDE